jgi:hypothetical protein
MIELWIYTSPITSLLVLSTWFGFLCVTAGLLMDKGHNGLLAVVLYLIFPLPMIVYAVGTPRKKSQEHTAHE